MTRLGSNTIRSHVYQRVGPPNHRGQPAAGADPDSVALADWDLEFRWSCDAIDIGITLDARDGKSIHGNSNDRD